MKEESLVEKNIELGMEFTRFLFEHPDMEKKIPRGALVVILPEYDRELAEFNLKIAERQREKGQPVVHIRIKKMASTHLSRLQGTEIELAG